MCTKKITIAAPLLEEQETVSLGGVLGGTEDWLEGEGDPIAEALEQLRQEHQELLERKHEILRGDSV